MKKLFIVASLPIVTLILFSLNHVEHKHTQLNELKHNIVKLSTMEAASNLLHELQIERGIGMSLLNKTNSFYFISHFAKQKKHTNKKMLVFISLTKNINNFNTSLSSKKYIENIKSSLDSIELIRGLILKKQITPKETFLYYTQLNADLISVFNSFKLFSDSQKTNSEITALYTMLQLQEDAGQERALVTKLIVSQDISYHDMQRYHKLLSAQKNAKKTIEFLLENQPSSVLLKKTFSKYTDSSFSVARKEILNHESEKELLKDIFKIIGYGGIVHNLFKYDKTKNEIFYKAFLKQRKQYDILMQDYLQLSDKKDKQYKDGIRLKNAFKNINKSNTDSINDQKILDLFNSLYNHHITLDPIEWFEKSTQRINDIHRSEDILFSSILKAINKTIVHHQNNLRNQIIITLSTILLLLLATFYISRKIKYSIAQLQVGIESFFDFLESKIDKPSSIKTNSNDEINDMAQNINQQLIKIEAHLEEDVDFINEITQIVTLMKDGDFTERPYFEPHNPNLKELKDVFNQLAELIASKIKEQTTSLESLNSSLEDRVHFQTLELEKQIKDITAAMQKAIQAEKAKDEFLANMSHEIRTPLNAILGFVTILKKITTEEKPLKYLNIINTSGNSLLAIINDILDFSKIQSGKFLITTHNVNIIEEMSHTTSLFASKAYEKHILYAVYIDPNIPGIVKLDSVRVKQIFSNILSNAIKFTAEDGAIEVNVTCENKNLIIAIKDTGIGIAEKNISKVFSAFEQADGTTTRKYGGTGLGLSISYKLAKLMEGDLSLTSKEGVGSTFTLTLPIEIIQEEPRHLMNIKEIKNYKIAILDNSQKTQKKSLLKKYLNAFGVENITMLTNYEKEGYDLLFFTPDDEYNEDIVYSTTPAVALLRSSNIKLANLKHINPLYFPYTPNEILALLREVNTNITVEEKNAEIEKEDDEEIQFIGSVLVAEDNKTNQMLISLILDDYDLDFVMAKNGLEAVTKYKEGNFDVVLMDENMPELNGIGAMQQIKAYEKENSLKVTPIIALTASVLETDRKMFINAGMDGFVGKPIDNKELESELARFLKVKE